MPILPSLPPIQFGSTLVQRILIAMLSLAFVSGAITGYVEVQHATEPLWYGYLSTALLITLTLCWYHVDSNDRHYARNIWLTMLIFGLAIVGIPTYLIRSRPPGKKLAALIWLIVFCCLFFSVNLLGELLILNSSVKPIQTQFS